MFGQGERAEHGAHMLGRGDHQPGVAARPGRRNCWSRGSPGRASGPCRKTGFSWMRLIAVDDLGLERPQQGLAPARRGDLGQRGAPGAAADHRQLFDPHAFTPAPRTFSAPSDRAASAPAPARRARRSARPRSAPPRPRRSSPHCRCTASRAARRSGGRCSLGELRRARRGPRDWRRRRRRRPGVGASRRFERAPRCGRRGSRPPPAGSWRRCRLGLMLAARHRALHRALEAGEGEMRLVASRPAGAAAAPPCGSPSAASASTAGPPG